MEGQARAAWAILAALLVIALSTAAADDGGRAGRAVEWADDDGAHVATPWPGTFYAVPLLTAAVIGAGAVLLGARAIAERPQIDAQSSEGDLLIRHRSAQSLSAAVLGTTGVTLAGIGVAMATATNDASSGTPAWVAVTHWLAWLGIVLAGGCLIGALVLTAQGAGADCPRGRVAA